MKCEQPVTALIGASGFGKAVLAKQIAHNAATGGHAVWLTPSELNTSKLSVLFADLGLLYSFPELAHPAIRNALAKHLRGSVEKKSAEKRRKAKE